MLSKNVSNCKENESKIYNFKEKNLDNSKCEYKKLEFIKNNEGTKPVENKKGFKPVVVKTREHKLYKEITLQDINNVRCRLNPAWSKYNLYMKMREAIINIPLELDDFYRNIIINHLLKQYEEDDKTLFKIVYEIEAPSKDDIPTLVNSCAICDNKGSVRGFDWARYYKIVFTNFHDGKKFKCTNDEFYFCSDGLTKIYDIEDIKTHIINNDVPVALYKDAGQVKSRFITYICNNGNKLEKAPKRTKNNCLFMNCNVSMSNNGELTIDNNLNNLNITNFVKYPIEYLGENMIELPEDNPFWEWVNSSLDGNLINLKYLLINLGVSMLNADSGNVRMVMCLQGVANAGKSVYMEIMKAILSDYNLNITSDQLIGESFAAENLVDKESHIIKSSITSDDCNGDIVVDDIPMIKALVSNDDNKINRKGKSYIDIGSIHVTMATNGSVSTIDEGIKARTFIMNFTKRAGIDFTPDPALLDRIKTTKTLSEIGTVAINLTSRYLKEHKQINPMIAKDFWSSQPEYANKDSVNLYVEALKEEEGFNTFEKEMLLKDAQKLTDIYRDYLLYCEDMGLKEEKKSRFYKLFDKIMKDLNKKHHEWHRSKYYKVKLIKSPNRHN